MENSPEPLAKVRFFYFKNFLIGFLEIVRKSTYKTGRNGQL